MWKHKTKWLVRGGRKVRCYLCGKKILAEGDLFLFHGDTGYYSHQSCLVESTTISGNERRRAVKKIAVGAAVVGAMAAGAGKFIDISSQSKGSLNSPDTQTILTSQGLILPSLTSDPANPVPGQMWYRSDAGVTAHFDAVQNRVVYSSEINDGNVNVTSKGIINGLSVLPNDGKGGFGPDTTKGATAPGQYGSPYTETSGILEGVNSLGGNDATIILSEGVFLINESIKIPSTLQGIHINGVNSLNTILRAVGSNFVNITTTPIPSISSVTPIIYFDGLNNLTHYDIGNFSVDANGSNVTISNSTQGVFLYLQQSSEAVIRGYIHDIVTLNFDGSGGTNTFPYSIVTTYSEGLSFERIWGVSNGSADGNIFIHAPDGAVMSMRIECFSLSFRTLIFYGTAITLNSTMYGSGYAVIMGLFFNTNGTDGNISTFSSPANTLYISIFGANIGSGSTSVGFFTTSGAIQATLNNVQFYGTSPGTPLFTQTISGSGTMFLYDTKTVVYVNTTVNYYAYASPSTMPASGTASQNTNRYPVDVYLFGGTVTQISITRGGTNFVVFSSSTGIALSGQVYKLLPSDSITLTYTTAPTWVWLSD